MVPTGLPADPQSTVNTLQRVHGLHLFLTFVLFSLNLFLTQLISTDRFIGRLKYVGHEMAFLGCGIVLSRLFTAGSGDGRETILATLFFYLFLWIVTLLLTRRVLSNAPIMLTPLIGATLLLGVASVAGSLSGFVEFCISEYFL